jgi:molybdopterin/thiamine biosynthesis adenylyltransferase
VVDGDVVSQSNLNRQVLYGEKDLGKNKAETAIRYFQEKYSDIQWTAISEFITVDNAQAFIFHYDLVIDGSDNFPTRYLVNDACVLLKKPLVYGSIYQYEGQVSVFNVGTNPCNYRDVFPNPPAPQAESAISKWGRSQVKGDDVPSWVPAKLKSKLLTVIQAKDLTNAGKLIDVVVTRNLQALVADAPDLEVDLKSGRLRIPSQSIDCQIDSEPGPNT